MKSPFGLLICLGLVAAPLCGQAGQAPTKPASNPFDLTDAKEQIGTLGVPTVADVDAAEKAASELVASGDCQKAVPALELFAKRANTLANLIAGGLQPFYGASYDDRKSARVGGLVKYEGLANGYKAKRDRAMIMQAECLIKLGQREQGAAMLVKALHLLSVSEDEWWTRARLDLYKLMAVN